MLESIPAKIDKFSDLWIRIIKEKPRVQTCDIYAVTIAKSAEISYTNFRIIINLIMENLKIFYPEIADRLENIQLK